MKEFSAIDFEGLVKGWITDVINFTPTLIGAIILHIVGRYAIRFILKLLKNLMARRQVDVVLQSFLLQVVRWVFYVALFLTTIQIIGLPATQCICCRRFGVTRVAFKLRERDNDIDFQAFPFRRYDRGQRAKRNSEKHWALCYYA